MTASDVLKIASNEIGVTEYPPGSNNVKYNTIFYGRDVYGDQYPWCCVFIWFCLMSIKGFPKTASCANLGNYFKKQGKFFTSNPKPGDVVFFKFSRNNNWTNHVGIVESVKGNSIITIEGNTSINSDDNGGAVMRRTRNSNIVGFGRPDYADSVAEPVAEPTKKQFPTLKRGDKNEYVRAWQNYLISCKIGCGKWGADADFGPDTEKAVKIYQLKMGLPVTGIIDQDDWNTVGKYK